MPVGRSLRGPSPGLNAGDVEISNSQRTAQSRGGTITAGLQREVQTSFAEKLTRAQANILMASSPAERMYIQSVDRPQEIVEAQFNPEKLRETLGVDWEKFRIPGLSYQRLHYGSTNNLQYRFELIYNAAVGAATQDISQNGTGVTGVAPETVLRKILNARTQLHAWTLLRRQDGLGAIGDTQRLLFVWPNFISLTCQLLSAESEYLDFNTRAQPTYFRVDVVLEEVRDIMLYAEDVLAVGTRRSGQGAEVG